MRFENSNLMEIHEIDLAQFSKLKLLDLSRNFLEFIEENLFKFNFDLEEIFLNNNKIQFVDSKAFENLKSLKILDFQENSCDSKILSSKSEIESLKCDENSFKAQMSKSNYELKFQIEILTKKVEENYENPLEFFHQIEIQNRKFVTETTIFMTVLGISVIAIVFYLASPFYRKLSEAKIENYEKFENPGKSEEIPKVPVTPEKAEFYAEPFDWTFEIGTAVNNEEVTEGK